MSESSSEKTKRKQVELLQSVEWVVQFSFFYAEYEDSRNVIEDNKLIRQRIRRLNSDTIFFCKLRFGNIPSEFVSGSPSDSPKVTMPYLSVYATKHFNRAEITQFLPLKLSGVLTVKNRRIEQHHIDNAINAIANQKLYNTQKHLDKQANSYSTINGKLLNTHQRRV